MAQQTTTALAERIRARIPGMPAGVPSYRGELAEVVARIAERFEPARVILFGSRAYGRPTAESDIDLMVVGETPRLRERLWEVRRQGDVPLPLDFHTRTPAQIRLGLAEHDFFIEDVMSGVTLYAGEGVDLSANDMSAGDGATRLKQATEEWLRKAETDFRAALALLHAADSFYDQVCFLAQQSVEKRLKAILQEREVRPPRTHDLPALARQATHSLPALAERTEDLRRLSVCAVDPRYPGLDVTRELAEDAVAIMTDIRELVRAALGLADRSPM